MKLAERNAREREERERLVRERATTTAAVAAAAAAEASTSNQIQVKPIIETVASNHTKTKHHAHDANKTEDLLR